MHISSVNSLSALALMIGDASTAAVRAATGLSPQELAALVLIRNRPGCSVTWLHERLGLTQSGAVRLIDRLQELGLVNRARTAGRREVSLSISLRGEAVADRGVSARGQAIESQLDGLPAADRDELLSLIERLLRALPRPRDEGDVACRLCDWSLCTPDCPMDHHGCGTGEEAAPAPGQAQPSDC